MPYNTSPRASAVLGLGAENDIEIREDIGMITRESLESMTPEEIAGLLAEVLERCHAAADAVNTAVSSYFPAVNEQERRVKERKAALEKERGVILSKIEGMRPALVKATISGNADALAEIQRTVKDLEMELTAVETQIGMLDGPLPSCDDVYNTIQTALKEKESIDEQTATDLETIKAFCEGKAQPWVELAKGASERPAAVSEFHLNRVRVHYSESRRQ